MTPAVEDGRPWQIPRPIQRLIEFAAACQRRDEPFSDELYAEATGLARSSARTYRLLAMRMGWWPPGIVVPPKRRGRPEAKPVTRPSSPVPPAIEMEAPDNDAMVPVDRWISVEQQIAALRIAEQFLMMSPNQRSATLTLASRLLNFLESGGDNPCSQDSCCSMRSSC